MGVDVRVVVDVVEREGDAVIDGVFEGVTLFDGVLLPEGVCVGLQGLCAAETYV